MSFTTFSSTSNIANPLSAQWGGSSSVSVNQQRAAAPGVINFQQSPGRQDTLNLSLNSDPLQLNRQQPSTTNINIYGNTGANVPAASNFTTGFAAAPVANQSFTAAPVANQSFAAAPAAQFSAQQPASFTQMNAPAAAPMAFPAAQPQAGFSAMNATPQFAQAPVAQPQAPAQRPVLNNQPPVLLNVDGGNCGNKAHGANDRKAPRSENRLNAKPASDHKAPAKPKNADNPNDLITIRGGQGKRHNVDAGRGNDFIQVLRTGNKKDVAHIRGGQGNDTVQLQGSNKDYRASRGDGFTLYTDKQNGSQYYVHNDVENVQFSKN